ncbi:DUF2059 domain-containing protein [Psychrobacter lutiphocae]|uniref:DUF2059 domain-containing protein n=1 Tax=Psychrobacter lutiphocae TaxID=540500 RepID=UPI000367B816|nr:DUF2059 domain-containing protein [Psychrobacter lutiphocae]
MARFHSRVSARVTQKLQSKLLALTATAMLTAVTPSHAELIISNSANVANTTNNSLSSSAKMDTVVNQNTAVPSEASVIKLMQVMRIDKRIEAVIEGKQAATDVLQNQGQNQDTDKPAVDKKVLEGQLKGILAQYAQIIVGGLQSHGSVEELTQAYIESVQAHYTQQEVDALIAFYDTPMGQSILDKNPKVAADFMQKSLPDEDQMQQTQDQFEQMLPQLKQVIKDAF